jgi:hypothetical protein
MLIFFSCSSFFSFFWMFFVFKFSENKVKDENVEINKIEEIK